MTATNKAMVIAGIATLIAICVCNVIAMDAAESTRDVKKQINYILAMTYFYAGGQILFTTLGLLQYFCFIDFLRELPLLIFIKIVYFHNPSTCGLRITIGDSIESMPDQALVLLTQTPLTATRTLYINAASLGLAVVWLITCFGIMRGGAIKKESKPIRWPWLIVTVLVCASDLVATVTYINDSFHTRTLSDLVDYIGGITSGTGNIDLSTTWVAWMMVLVYSRFVGLFLLNLTLIVIVVIHVSAERMVESTGIQVEAQTTTQDAGTSADLDESISEESEPVPTGIPRPGLSQSFRRMKERLFGRNNATQDRARNIAQIETGPDSSDTTPDRTPRAQHVDIDKKRTVNFPDKLVSLPERLENLIAEQRRRLDAAADTGRCSPPRASQSLPQLPPVHDNRPRRGTAAAAELQAQLPWAYVPGAAHHMRDQLPPDEDLPPVPLPDYTACRKASVHRAASSLSSLTQKRDEMFQIPRPPLTSLDVLY